MLIVFSWGVDLSRLLFTRAVFKKFGSMILSSFLLDTKYSESSAYPLNALDASTLTASTSDLWSSYTLLEMNVPYLSTLKSIWVRATARLVTKSLASLALESEDKCCSRFLIPFTMNTTTYRPQIECRSMNCAHTRFFLVSQWAFLKSSGWFCCKI